MTVQELATIKGSELYASWTEPQKKAIWKLPAKRILDIETMHSCIKVNLPTGEHRIGPRGGITTKWFC